MKNNSLTLINMHVNDSKQYIESNVAEHLINEIRSLEFGYYSYMTENEIDEYEKATNDRREAMRQEIEDFINENFNYEIEKQS